MNSVRRSLWIRRGVVVMIAVAALTLGACGKKTPQEKLQKARDLNQQQKPFDALIELRRIQQDHAGDPIIPEVLFELARTHAALGQFEQAEERFKEVITSTGYRDSRGQAAVRILLELYQRGEQFDKALDLTQDYLKALPSDDPTTRPLELSIAQLYIFKGDNNAAISILERLALSSPGVDDRLFAGEFLAAAYAREKRFDDSVKEYDIMLSRVEDPAFQARIQIGKAYYLGQAGRTDESDELTSQALGVLQQEFAGALDPMVKIRTKMEMARAYELLKKDDLAEAAYREIITTFAGQPNLHEIYDILAGFYADRKQWDKARATLEEERAKFPSPLIAERINVMLDQLEAIRLQDQSTTPTESANAPQ